MTSFTKIDGAKAITRTKAGVYAESDIYALGTDVFIPHGKGYARLTCLFGTDIMTSVTGLKVTKLTGEGLVDTKFGVAFQPKKKAGLKAA